MIVQSCVTWAGDDVAVQLRGQRGRIIKGLSGIEGDLTCSCGGRRWRYLGQFGPRLDFSCVMVLKNRMTLTEYPCGGKGTVFLGSQPEPFPRAGEPYATLQAVILALGTLGKLDFQSLCNVTGLRPGALRGCIARLLRRELVTYLRSNNLLTGHRIVSYALSPSGLLVYSYLKGGESNV